MSLSFPKRENEQTVSTIERDTIAAISTAVGPSGIGIVRISGPAAIAVADRLFRAGKGRPLAEAESHTIHYGHIAEGETLLDEVLVSVLRAPRTYTRDDIVEIHCHGGVLVLRRVLEAILRAGARLARPGEFTKRAFLNGRIDLSQAEAVMDLIASENKSAADSALSQLGGVMRRRVGALRETLLHECAYIEAALDDPEHYDMTDYAPVLKEKLESVKADIDALLETAEEGRILKNGVSTVILGRPNVGKSTLLNLLAGTERAIVTEIAGTTRDVLEEQVVLSGVPLRIMDTAGLRETADTVEQIGVARAKAAAEKADLILYILNGAEIRSEEDAAYLKTLAGNRDADKAGAATNAVASDANRVVSSAGGAAVILILNKCDLKQQLSDEDAGAMLPGAPLVKMAARDGQGLRTLGELVRERFFRGDIAEKQEVYITNTRHKEALQDAADAIARTLQSISDGMPEDLFTVDLMDAYAALGQVIGEDVDEDLIDRVFSEFCMGK
ncbi:MAG: tRNA uridine-5-carboxymethylaminomethyl(34) synthesis GTPase MnmE [Firmicutes bacterium]|nr:tRNA uridine-5-carboxymethylaminomethyl(34) synthesis GTPase MnmE [Bacillota bacterium]